MLTDREFIVQGTHMDISVTNFYTFILRFGRSIIASLKYVPRRQVPNVKT